MCGQRLPLHRVGRPGEQMEGSGGRPSLGLTDHSPAAQLTGDEVK